MPILAVNKKAKFDYDIIETYEAGLVLLGHEVKSIKSGQVNLRGSFINFKDSKNKTELFLFRAQVSPYKKIGTINDYDPLRARKLLLKKKEIDRLLGKRQEAGLTLVPLKIYTKHSLIKLEFALARGRKKYDKRELIKKRDVEKRLRSLTKK